MATESPAASNIYQPLQEDEIRILTLCPARFFLAPLHLRISTVKLSDRPAYTALSYVWGSPVQEYPIFVSGVCINVTKNLMFALRRIRQDATERTKQARKTGSGSGIGGDGAITLWTDALCINQADADERNVQVQKMSHIYRDAQEVISWLGAEKNWSAEAMQLLRRWGEALTKVGITKFEDVDEKIEWFQSGTNARDFVRSIERPFSFRGWLGLSALLKRPYWNRLWVFQEFVLGGKNTVMCGRERIPWEYLLLVPVLSKCKELLFYDLDYKNNKKFQSKLKLLNSDFLLPIEDLLRYRNLRLPEQLERGRVKVMYEGTTLIHRPSLLDWLYTVSFRSCTDPRDIIFAMTGFWEDETPSIDVNYHLSVEETYQAFARDCLLASRLQVLCFAGLGYSQTRKSDLPSWVADWRHETTRANWPREFRYECYSAGVITGRQGLPPRMSNAGRSVTIQGIICDTVSAKQNNGPWKGENDKDDDKFTVLSKWGAEKRYITGMPFRQACFRTFLADVDPFTGLRLFHQYSLEPEKMALHERTCGGLALSYLARGWFGARSERLAPDPNGRGYTRSDPKRSALENLSLDSTELNTLFLDHEKPTPERFEAWKQTALKAASRLNEAASTSSWGHCWFFTGKGYMGLGPPLTQRGDVLCILQDAKVPFVLRPDGDGYLVVGEAFLLGLMDGDDVVRAGFAGMFEDITLH